MAEFDSGSLHIVSTKLSNLLKQIDTASNDDLTNEDVKAALRIMETSLSQLISFCAEAEDYDSALKEQIVIEAGEHIRLHSRVLGFIIRSSTTRNPFELYHPFRNIAGSFFPGEKVYLILSSEWDYVPFTYPMTLDDLPNYILIGMPAVEADNVLAFPLAGHELGHSIWKRNDLRAKFSPPAYDLTRKRFDEEPELLRALFPGISKDEFESDLFSSRLRDTTISQIISYCLKQLEEVFCDLIGISIFGIAYHHAFRYLLAPAISNRRSLFYPELSERAQLLDTFGKSVGLGDVAISRWFTQQQEVDYPFEAALVRIADGVRRALWDELTSAVREVVAHARIPATHNEAITWATQRFLASMPVENSTTLGELISAAWEFYSTGYGEKVEKSKHLEMIVSNLVLKSAEAMEFKARARIVGNK